MSSRVLKLAGVVEQPPLTRSATLFWHGGRMGACTPVTRRARRSPPPPDLSPPLAVHDGDELKSCEVRLLRVFTTDMSPLSSLGLCFSSLLDANKIIHLAVKR